MAWTLRQGGLWPQSLRLGIDMDNMRAIGGKSKGIFPTTKTQPQFTNVPAVKTYRGENVESGSYQLCWTFFIKLCHLGGRNLD